MIYTFDTCSITNQLLDTPLNIPQVDDIPACFCFWLKCPAAPPGSSSSSSCHRPMHSTFTTRSALVPWYKCFCTTSASELSRATTDKRRAPKFQNRESPTVGTGSAGAAPRQRPRYRCSFVCMLGLVAAIARWRSSTPSHRSPFDC